MYRTSILKYFYSAFIFTLLTFSSNAQEIEKIIADGNEYFANNKFEEATATFKSALKIDSNNVEANFKCAQSLFKSGLKAASLPFFKKTYQLNPHYDKFLLKYLGRAYQLNYKFDTAIAVFKEYETHLHKHEIIHQTSEKELIEKRIQECMTAKELVKKPKQVVIKNLGKGINSKYDDYSPAISADEQKLMFTSRRDHDLGNGNEFSKKDYEYYEEVFITERNDSVWMDAKSLGDNVNGKKHDACVSVSPDGHKLILYKSNHISKGDLYYSDFKNEEWTEPVKFGGDINTNFFEPSATINAAENLLIFSSDRPGGYGGLDLYVSRLLPTGKWGKSKNLGPVINTKYDEDAPFLQTDQRTLHFSSSGHNSIGGYDIFTTVYDAKDDIWSIPENVGVPINTPDDDIYFSWNNDGNRAYFSSVREDGIGGQDLYMMELPEISPPIVVIKGTVTDKKTMKPLGSLIKISVYTIDSSMVVGLFNSNNSTGKYLLALPHNNIYGMQVEADGYIFHSENYAAPKTFDFLEIVKDFELQPIEEGNKVVLNNIFFDYNKSSLRPESETELKAVVDFMNKNTNISVEIGGNTDSIGSFTYNQKLSEARALEVKNKLLVMGIDVKRLQHKGYSFSKPIATNQTPEGRQLNRRTEFLILNKTEEASQSK